MLHQKFLQRKSINHRIKEGGQKQQFFRQTNDSKNGMQEDDWRIMLGEHTSVKEIHTGLGKIVVPRLRELAPCGQRESGGGIHAT